MPNWIHGLVPYEDTIQALCVGILFASNFVDIVPVRKVDRNIGPNGIQVPVMLRNISRLLLISRATTKKSTAITKPRKMSDVCNGVVRLNLLKYTSDTSMKYTGAPMAWMIRALPWVVLASPIPMVAAQAIQPAHA